MGNPKQKYKYGEHASTTKMLIDLTFSEVVLPIPEYKEQR
jgi:hypothetical protein